MALNDCSTAKSSVAVLHLFKKKLSYPLKENSCFYYCSLRIGVAFTGTNGDIMEIKTFGKSEKYVKYPKSISLQESVSLT